MACKNAEKLKLQYEIHLHRKKIFKRITKEIQAKHNSALEEFCGLLVICG